MKPWYKKTKVWAALLTAIAYGLGDYFKNQELANGILYVGMAFLAAMGLEDIGKAKEAMTRTGGQGGQGGRGGNSLEGTGGVGGPGGQGGSGAGLLP